VSQKILLESNVIRVKNILLSTLSAALSAFENTEAAIIFHLSTLVSINWYISAIVIKSLLSISIHKSCLNIVDIMDGYSTHSSFVHIFINHENTIAKNCTAKVKCGSSGRSIFFIAQY